MAAACERDSGAVVLALLARRQHALAERVMLHFPPPAPRHAALREELEASYALQLLTVPGDVTLGADGAVGQTAGSMHLAFARLERLGAGALPVCTRLLDQVGAQGCRPCVACQPPARVADARAAARRLPPSTCGCCWCSSC